MKRVFLLFLISIYTSSVFAQENNSSTQRTDSSESDVNVDYILGKRDPFSPPKYIREKEFYTTKENSGGKMLRPEDIIDKQMEAIRRWPLTDYKLVAVIWDVKNPKAMILDKANTMHLLKKNYRIGNREGVITEINESEIVVLQNETPFVIQIERSRGSGLPSDSAGQVQLPKTPIALPVQKQNQNPKPNQTQNQNSPTNPTVNPGGR
jgi:Pilus assembly protein, PilP